MGISDFDRIYAWMKEHQQEMLEDLKRLAKIPSVSDAQSEVKPFGKPCRDVLDEFFSIALERGFQCENYEYYCGSVWLSEQAGQVEDCIGMWSHLDVVPPGEGWHSDPFDPIERDGYLIGRGVDDNKCAAIGALYGLLAIKELGIPVSHPLRLFGGTNEEVGMADLSYYVEHYACPKHSIIPDSGFPVCFGEKGSMTLTLTSDAPACERLCSLNGGAALNTVPERALAVIVGEPNAAVSENISLEQQDRRCVIEAKGIAGHIAFPEGSKNALGCLTKFLYDCGIDLECMGFLCRLTSETDGSFLGIAQSDDISGPLTCVGVTAALTEDRRYQLKLGIRYPVTADWGAIVDAVTKAAVPNGFAVNIVKNSAPNLYPKDSPAVWAITDIYQKATGETREPFTMGGGTYARKLPNAFASGLIGGLPDDTREDAFHAGCGGCHQPDEAIKIENFPLGAAIFAAGIVAVDKLLD